MRNDNDNDVKNGEVRDREIVHAVVGGSEVTAEVEETAGNLTGEWCVLFVWVIKTTMWVETVNDETKWRVKLDFLLLINYFWTLFLVFLWSKTILKFSEWNRGVWLGEGCHDFFEFLISFWHMNIKYNIIKLHLSWTNIQIENISTWSIR